MVGEHNTQIAKLTFWRMLFFSSSSGSAAAAASDIPIRLVDDDPTAEAPRNFLLKERRAPGTESRMVTSADDDEDAWRKSPTRGATEAEKLEPPARLPMRLADGGTT